MARIDGYNQPSVTTKKDTVFTWTNVYEDDPSSPAASGVILNLLVSQRKQRKLYIVVDSPLSVKHVCYIW